MKKYDEEMKEKDQYISIVESDKKSLESEILNMRKRIADLNN